MRRRHGFTIIEVLVAAGAACVLGVILQPVVSGVGEPSKRFKDADQLRRILQAHMIWAGANNGAYPLPSDIDVNGTTDDVGQGGDPERAVQLDTTGYTFSVLIFNGLVVPEDFVSPAETNGLIIPYFDYEYDCPEAAADPCNALWDPAFHGTPIQLYNLGTQNNPPDLGNNSYAQNPALGRRALLWADNGDPNQVVLGNRGPAYEGDAVNGWQLKDGIGGTWSLSISFYNDAETWNGNIAYNDGRVDFEPGAIPEDLLWTFPHLPPRLQVQPDNIFQNESRAGDARTESPNNQGEAVVHGQEHFISGESDFNAYLRPVADVRGSEGNLSFVSMWID